MNEKFAQLLKNLDLTPTQIKIYLANLDLGLATVFDISKFTKINRPQIYLDTAILIEKGFLELAAKRRKKFLAVSPFKISKLAEEKKNKLKELEMIIPEVGKFYEEKSLLKDNKFEIRIYEGLENIKKAYRFELEESKNSRIDFLIGDMEMLIETVSNNYIRKWIKECKENKLIGRLLTDKNLNNFNNLKKDFVEGGIETRGIDNFLLDGHFEVWKDYVLIVSLGKIPKAVIIKNDILANTFKAIFEKLWKNSHT